MNITKISTFERIVEDICDKEAEQVRKILINMTFSPSLFFDLNQVTEEEKATLLPEWKKLRKEIRNTYSLEHPFFQMGVTPETEFPATIRSSTQSDIYLMEYLDEMLNNYLEHTKDISRVCYLLRDTAEEENKRFGGLRELGFNYRKAQKLLEFTELCPALADWLEEKLFYSAPEEEEEKEEVTAFDEQNSPRKTSDSCNEEIPEVEEEDNVSCLNEKSSTKFSFNEYIFKLLENKDKVARLLEITEELLNVFSEEELKKLFFQDRVMAESLISASTSNKQV